MLPRQELLKEAAMTHVEQCYAYIYCICQPCCQQKASHRTNTCIKYIYSHNKYMESYTYHGQEILKQVNSIVTTTIDRKYLTEAMERKNRHRSCLSVLSAMGIVRAIFLSATIEYSKVTMTIFMLQFAELPWTNYRISVHLTWVTWMG